MTIDGLFTAGHGSKRSFLSSNDAPSNAAIVAAEEALFNAFMPFWMNMWDASLPMVWNMVVARGDAGLSNGAAVFEGS